MRPVVLQHELLGDLRDVAPRLVRQVEGLAVGEHAVAYLQHLRAGVARLDGDGDRVVARHVVAGDAAALQQRTHGLQPVALDRRLLELLRLGGGAHALLDVALDGAEAARQEVDHAVHGLAVLLARDLADARRPTALDVVIQARAAAAPARLGARAGARHEDLREHLERSAHPLGVGVGPEVQAPRPVTLAREIDAGEVLVERDRDERVGLVVAQADVETRPVLLDEGLLGEQRLGLARHHDALDVLDEVDHLGVALRVLGARRREVRRDPLPHGLCLADIDDGPGAVAEEVDPRLVGEGTALRGEV